MRSQSALSPPVNSSLCWIYPEKRSHGEGVRGPRMEGSLRTGMSVEYLHKSGKQIQKAERWAIRQEARGGSGGRGRGEDIGSTPSSSSVRLWKKESHVHIMGCIATTQIDGSRALNIALRPPLWSNRAGEVENSVGGGGDVLEHLMELSG